MLFSKHVDLVLRERISRLDDVALVLVRFYQPRHSWHRRAQIEATVKNRAIGPERAAA
jgi:hypothetical protein